MIESDSDFALVNVNPFKAFFDEFESYPARADAADGMPYDSLSDLEGLIDPPLKCLDPAWLTEIVREVEWFRTNGFGGGYARPGWSNPGPASATPTNVAGAKQPPVVLKAFLEEARATIRTWATAWEDGCPMGVVVEEGAVPTEWTSIGAIRMEWETSNTSLFTSRFTNGDGLGLPYGANSYEIPSSDLDPLAGYRRLMAKAAVRDFLSIRLFDREMPDDDLDVPEFAWQETDDQFEEGDERGVSVKYLSRQLLALHSDCEKAAMLFVPLGAAARAVDAVDKLDRTTGQTETNGRHKTHDDCSDGCGTIHSGPGSTDSLDAAADTTVTASVPDGSACPPDRVPAEIGPVGPFPVRYSFSCATEYEAHRINSCHHATSPCPIYTHAVEEFWGSRTSKDRSISYEGMPTGMTWPCELPEWIETDEVHVVMVASSRRLKNELSRQRVLTNPTTGALADFKTLKGGLDSALYVAAVPAEYDGHYLTVSEIPDVPQPSGGTQVDVPGFDPHSEPSEPSGDVAEWGSDKMDEDAAGIVAVLGVVAKVKFRASVKED